MSAGVYRDIYYGLADPMDREHGTEKGMVTRLLKIQEEAGEVAEAYIGYYGINVRKGCTHTREDVAKELADVVITAMVALHDWVSSPELFMQEHLEELLKRIREEGS